LLNVSIVQVLLVLISIYVDFAILK